MLPKRDSREEISRGVRLLASEMGMFSYDRSFTPEQVARSFRISSDLFLAKGIEASVMSTTPAWPSECEMIHWALMPATSSTRVVTLVKSSGLRLGPGAATACQPMSGMPALSACASCSDVELGSKPPMTMPEGLRAKAVLIAAWTPAGVPSPSITLTFQPMTRAASRRPFAAPATPGLVMVWAT